ncbi:MAG: YfhO family protein [Caldilineaceae bacterium]|nr:YfhO family protein [Caldilineaceae bacterium]
MDEQSVDERTATVKGNRQPGRRAQRREWLIAGGFCLLAALFYGPVLLGLRAFPDGDFTHHFFPFSLYQHQALAAGHLAVWNPYTYGGHPFLADVQAAVYYPVSNLILLLSLPVTDAAARLYWLQVEAVVHTALAGCFAYLWARDLTGSRWSGLVGGVAFALSGYVTGYAPLQLAVLRTAVWLPLLWWCLGRGWQRPHQWRWWLGSIGAVSAAFLAGHSQSFLFLGYATAAWVLCLVLANRSLRRAAVVGVSGVVVAAVGLTAAQWLPSLEFVRLSVRANVDYAFVSGGLPIQDLWQMLLPGVLTQYSPLYIGIVGLVLGMVAVYIAIAGSDGQRTEDSTNLLSRRTGIFFCLGLVVFAWLAALGGNGPLYPLLYRVAPGWAWFRGQERAAYLVVVGLSGLAAYGMALLPSLPTRGRRRAGLLAGAVVVATVYAFGLLWQLPGRTAVDHGGYLLTAGMTLLLGLAAALLVALPGWTARRGAWMVALVVVNLVWVNAGTNQVAGTPADRVRVAPEVSALIEAVAERSGAANGLPGRVYNEFRAYEDYGMRAQVEDVWGSSPLRVARYAALFENFPLDRMWRLLGVEHVLTWRRELFGPSTLLGEFPQTTDTTYLHRLPDANPRAWLVPNVVVVEDEAAWAHLADHQFDLGQTGLLGPESGWAGDLIDAPANSATVTLARRAADAYQVHVTSEQGGLLVVSETWLPGWEVVEPRCDGDACPTHDAEGRAFFAPLRADLTLLGIWLPPGETLFEMRYRPFSVRLGLWGSGGTLFVLLVAALWHRHAGRCR